MRANPLREPFECRLATTEDHWRAPWQKAEPPRPRPAPRVQEDEEYPAERGTQEVWFTG